MKRIVDFIEHLECPSISGIIFPDETIQLLDTQVDWRIPINYSIRTGSKTTINNLHNSGHLQWNSCAVLTKLIDHKRSIEVVAGEGNYGSDGFVGVIELDSKKLIWLAFFNSSDPFDKVEIIEDQIHARSTIGCTWKFTLKNPEKCVAICS